MRQTYHIMILPLTNGYSYYNLSRKILQRRRQFSTNGTLEKTRKPCILHTYEGAIVSGPVLPDGILQLKLTLKCEKLFGKQCHLALLCAYGRAFLKTE